MIASNVLALSLAVAGAAAAPLAKRSSSGQATFYTAGLGACGWYNSGSDFIVAMNAPEWNNGAQCGQMVTITNNQNGNTQTAQIVDLCPGCSYGSLDMSTSLFSALNNGNMDAGVFPITWTYGNNQAAAQNNQQQAKQQPTTTQQAPKTTYTPTSTWSPSATPSAQSTSWAAATSTPSSSASYAPQPSSAANTDTVVSTPEWWNGVGNNCNVDLAPASIPMGISGSEILAEADLWKACGKWVQIKNNQNGKQLSLQVTNTFSGNNGDVALAQAYRILANNYENPEHIESVTWGFIDGQGI